MRVAIPTVRFKYDGYPYVVTFVIPRTQYVRIASLDKKETGETLSQILIVRWNLDSEKFEYLDHEEVQFATASDDVEETEM